MPLLDTSTYASSVKSCSAVPLVKPFSNTARSSPGPSVIGAANVRVIDPELPRTTTSVPYGPTALVGVWNPVFTSVPGE